MHAKTRRARDNRVTCSVRREPRKRRANVISSSVRVEVVRFEREGVCVKWPAARSGPEWIVRYSEMFAGEGKIRRYASEARCGDQVLRVGDVTEIEQSSDGRWTRRPIIERALREAEKGEIVLAKVSEIDEESVCVTTTSGLAAHCTFDLLEGLLDRDEEFPNVNDAPRVFAGKIKIGDSLVGRCERSDEKGLLLDVSGYLAELNRESLVPKWRRDLAKQKVDIAVTRTRPAEFKRCDEQVSRPSIAGRVLIIDDFQRWIEKTSSQLGSNGAEVEVLPEEKWSQARREAERLRPRWILVDVHLDESNPHEQLGLEIAKELVAGDVPWEVLVVTHGDLDRVRYIPEGAHGPISKSKVIEAMAAIAAGHAVAARPAEPLESTDAEELTYRRSPQSTARQIDALLRQAETELGADLAVLGYDFLRDKARFLFGSDDMQSRFNRYADHLQKSQIRDLAYDRAEEAWKLYPAARHEEPWRWLRKLWGSDLRHAVGVRLGLPNRDCGAVLFAFWTETAEYTWPEDLEETIENRTILGTLRAYGTAIEDACWHEKHENQLAGNREEMEKSRRSEDLSHEVKTFTGEFLGMIADLRNRFGADDTSLDVELKRCERKANLVESLTDEILAPAEVGQERIPLEEVLNECAARYSSAREKIKVVGPIVTPHDLAFYGRKDLLVLIVDNLLRNAIAAIRKAPRPVEVDGARRIGQIVIEACPVRADNSFLQVLIHDTGCGISQVVLERMYGHHYSTFGGTGLGMGICRRTAARLGGRVEVLHTALRAGTTFRIVLPAAPESEE